MIINKKRLINTFLNLVNVSSPAKKEREVADIVKRLLIGKTDRIKEDDCARKIGGNCGNIVAIIRGNYSQNKPPLLFNVHMDTVTPCDSVNPVREKGIIRSDGTAILGADDKAGIAAVIELVNIRKEQEQLPWCNIVILFTVAEEIGLYGSKHCNISEFIGAPAYVLDSVSDVGVVTNRAPYGERLSIELFGKAAHAGVHPEQGKNAVLMSARALTEIKLGRIDDETTANIGKVHGGRAINIVPDYVRLDGEIRSHNEKKLLTQENEMIDIFTKEAQQLGGKAEIKTQRDYNGFHIAKSEEIIKIALDAAKKIGKKGDVMASGGGSDANIFNQKGLQAVALGVGYENPHTLQEKISEKKLVAHCEWIYQIARIYSEEE